MKKLMITLSIACFAFGCVVAQPLTALNGKPSAVQSSVSSIKAIQMQISDDENATSEFMKVTVNNVPTQSTFSLYDKFGREVISRGLLTGDNTIAVAQLPAGCYVANVLDMNGQFLYSMKILVD
jgi:hypothetical protein